MFASNFNNIKFFRQLSLSDIYVKFFLSRDANAVPPFALTKKKIKLFPLSGGILVATNAQKLSTIIELTVCSR